MPVPKARRGCWRWRQRSPAFCLAKNAGRAQSRHPGESSKAPAPCRAGVRKPAWRETQGRRRRRNASTCRTAETGGPCPETTSRSRTRGIRRPHRQATLPKTPGRGFGTVPARSSPGDSSEGNWRQRRESVCMMVDFAAGITICGLPVARRPPIRAPHREDPSDRLPAILEARGIPAARGCGLAVLEGLCWLACKILAKYRSGGGFLNVCCRMVIAGGLFSPLSGFAFPVPSYSFSRCLEAAEEPGWWLYFLLWFSVYHYTL